MIDGIINTVQKIPLSRALESKEYPMCGCGRKYVPIPHRDKTRCLLCQIHEVKPSVRKRKYLEKKLALVK